MFNCEPASIIAEIISISPSRSSTRFNDTRAPPAPASILSTLTPSASRARWRSETGIVQKTSTSSCAVRTIFASSLQPQRRVQHYSQQPPPPRQPRSVCQQRIVGQHRVDACNQRIRSVPHELHYPLRFFSCQHHRRANRDSPRSRSDPPVERQSRLKGHKRQLGSDITRKAVIQLLRLAGQNPDFGSDPRSPQPFDPLAIHRWIRVRRSHHHPRHAGLDQCLSTRPRSPSVATGLQSHISGRAASRIPGHRQGHNLGMVSPLVVMKPLAEHRRHS